MHPSDLSTDATTHLQIERIAADPDFQTWRMSNQQSDVSNNSVTALFP
jgi:hypothetical protein